MRIPGGCLKEPCLCATVSAHLIRGFLQDSLILCGVHRRPQHSQLVHLWRHARPYRPLVLTKIHGCLSWGAAHACGCGKRLRASTAVARSQAHLASDCPPPTSPVPVRQQGVPRNGENVFYVTDFQCCQYRCQARRRPKKLFQESKNYTKIYSKAKF